MRARAETGPPRARRADPLSSHAAADELERSGRDAAQSKALLDAVRQWPGRSTRALAEITGMDRHALGRRASELDDRGEIVRHQREDEDATLWIAGSEVPLSAGPRYARKGATPAPATSSRKKRRCTSCEQSMDDYGFPKCFTCDLGKDASESSEVAGRVVRERQRRTRTGVPLEIVSSLSRETAERILDPWERGEAKVRGEEAVRDVMGRL